MTLSYGKSLSCQLSKRWRFRVQPKHAQRHGLKLEDILRMVNVSASGCWNWQGFRNQNGYGIFLLPPTEEHPRQRCVSARRLIADFYDILPPAGRNIRFTCGNPMCVNPEHTIVGYSPLPTHARGERAGRARLREEHIQQIHDRARAGENQSALAREFGVTSGYVTQIKQETAWRHLWRRETGTAITTPS